MKVTGELFSFHKKRKGAEEERCHKHQKSYFLFFYPVFFMDIKIKIERII